ncbi:MAG: 2-phosphosulfolactate phosphatase, partial [Planctomycetaceae bacterium]|nr:2-phosphosulfolactate phosphatase [Planctomycetaceae bacterium]
MKTISTALLPQFIDPVVLPETAAVVIDVLRASTTITTALAHGAAAVAPCLTPEEALAWKDQSPKGTVFTGGERKGQLIPGFDCDNSPFSYPEDVVRGKTIAFTTTNGTRTLHHCLGAREVLIGAFVNRAALVDHLEKCHSSVVLACAGTNDQLSGEDILFAGAAIDDLLGLQSGWQIADVQTQMALDFFRARNSTPESFRGAFVESRGAQNLTRLGYLRDIERAMENSLYPFVPVYDPESKR